MLSQNEYITSKKAFNAVRDSDGIAGDVSVTKKGENVLYRASFKNKPKYPIEFLFLTLQQ